MNHKPVSELFDNLSKERQDRIMNRTKELEEFADNTIKNLINECLKEYFMNNLIDIELAGELVSIKLPYKKLHPDAKVPTYAHEGDSGMDVYALNDEVIQAGEIRGIRTGISFEVPPGYEIQVRSKSGLALKYITVANSPGTVDSSYTGELVVILQNQSASWYQIGAGQKIAQIVFCPVVKAELEEVEEFKSTTRGDGGFGSTGLV